MRLSRSFALSFLTLLAACSLNEGPRALSSTYYLNDIDGRALPTPPAFTPGLTPTILSSVLTLSRDGNASFTDHRIEYNGFDDTVVYYYTYKINGFNISFTPAARCLANVDCPGPDLTGKILGNNLSIARSRVNSNLIYFNYRPPPSPVFTLLVPQHDGTNNLWRS